MTLTRPAGSSEGSEGSIITLSAPAGGQADQAEETEETAWAAVDRWGVLADGALVPDVNGGELRALDFRRVTPRPSTLTSAGANDGRAESPHLELVVYGLARCAANAAVCDFLSGPVPFDWVTIDQMRFDMSDPLDCLLVQLVLALARNRVRPNDA